MLSLAILAGGIVAFAASFSFAYFQAQEFQDDMLRQVAAISGGGNAAQRLKSAAKTINDPESKIDVYRLSSDKAPPWLPRNIRAGFHTMDGPLDQGAMRVFVRIRGTSRIIVAQSTESRNEIAQNSALLTLIPLLILVPVLIFLVSRIIRRELATVRKLSEQLDRHGSDQPQSLPEGDLPNEILPFVQAINRLFERVTKMVSEQRRFIADAAHELRTPLTALSLQAQNLSQADTLEAMRERLVPLQAGIERARKLTVQLLGLARLQAEGQVFDTVDVSNLAREVISESLPKAEEKSIELVMEELVHLSFRTDPESLRIILHNALDNALKYTPRSGMVTVALFKEGNHAVIEVNDNGPGIPEAQRENVFNAFYRLPGSQAEGSGLGLAIAREAANRLGGEISLSNQTVGSGLIFRLTLPERRKDGSSE